MIVHQGIANFKAGNPVVTVGIFDGVHLGHRHILEHLRHEADSSKGESVVVTLWPHPRMVLKQEDNDFRMLNTLDEKIKLLDETGIQHLVILPFTPEFSRLSSCDFIEQVLVRGVGIKQLVVGYNHRFGRDREGDYGKLKTCAEKFGFGISQLKAYQLKDRKISSSEIRNSLTRGAVSEAIHLLGRPYALSGTVIGGSRLGTSIGFPTANITPDEKHKLLPADGVYAVEAELKNQIYKGMMNMGSRPTVNDDPDRKTIEVHLIDFEDNIYSERIIIRFIERLRDEQRFDSIEALKEQLVADREKTRLVFADS